MSTLTKQLREAIQRDGRSLRAIGEAADSDKSILSRFLRGERTLTLRSAENICDALNVDVYLIPRSKRRGRGRLGLMPER